MNLITKLHRLLDSAIDAFDAVADSAHMGFCANAVCEEAQRAVMESHKQTQQTYAEINEITLQLERTRLEREKLDLQIAQLKDFDR